MAPMATAQARVGYADLLDMPDDGRRYERCRESLTRLFVLVYGHVPASVYCSVHNS